jgi:arylsulfatase A-like enzyme
MSQETNRRVFLRSVGLGALAAGAQGSFAAPERRSKPNVVFILADDLGYGDLGCYNPESRIPTPNLDRLAGQGVRFTDAHSPSAVCTPTRYGIMTGRYCWRTRLKQSVLNGYSPSLIEPGRLTLASLLKRQGYRTACIGKWHLGLGSKDPADYDRPLLPGPNDVGFDYFFGIPASLDMPPYVYVENDRVLEQPTGSIGDVRQNRGVFWRGGPIAPGFRHADVLPELARRAVGFLRDHSRRRPAPPFLLYLALTAPHTPWLPSGAFRKRARAGEYGDFVSMMDDAAGQVLRVLDEQKLAGDTLVVFASDNGAYWLPEEIERWGHRANHFLRGQKSDIWEGGHRIPFLARWPGRIAPGRVSGETACLTDLLATAADITGYSIPDGAGEDSFSLLPALLGRRLGKPIREAVVHHSGAGHFSIRKGDWKLHLGRGSGGFSEPRSYTPAPGEPQGELFNLAEDPAEANNLYLERPEVVKSLAALLEKYKRQGHSRPTA